MNTETKTCDLPATLARMGHNVTLVKQLAEFCHEDLPIYLARLEDAVVTGNKTEIQVAAHRVKGLVVNFSADPAANAAIRLEQMGQNGDLAGAADAFRDLEQQVSRFLAQLTMEFSKL